jgi:hypothetical protein
MFIHSVYFWMADDLDDEARAAFEQGLQTLCEETTATSGYYGKPAVAKRDVVDGSYGYGLILFFDDAADQDAYQISDVHQAFIANHSAKWERVLVYDTVVD